MVFHLEKRMLVLLRRQVQVRHIWFTTLLLKKKVWRVQASCVDYLYAQSPIYVHTCLSRDDIHVDVDAPKTTLVYACICAFLIYFYMHACKLDMNSCFHIYPKNIHYPNIILTCPVGRLTTPPRVHVVNGSMFCGS